MLDCADPKPNAPYDIWDFRHEWFTTDQLWWAKDRQDSRQISRNGRNFTPVTFLGDNFFLVYMDVDMRMRVVHVVESTGYEAEYFLDPNPDYYVRENFGYQDWSIGLDEKGYIHIMGDSNYFPFQGTDGLPDRYLGAKCMGWRSDNPMDVSSFSFRGHETKHCPHGTSFTLPRYLRDSLNRLYWAGSAGGTSGESRRMTRTPRASSANSKPSAATTGTTRTSATSTAGKTTTMGTPTASVPSRSPSTAPCPTQRSGRSDPFTPGHTAVELRSATDHHWYATFPTVLTAPNAVTPQPLSHRSVHYQAAREPACPK
eukprot:Polyplicarium_translucidae@DN2019_c0_g1_i1.p1